LGYTGVFDSKDGCQSCKAGHFKDVNGSTPCSSCAAGKYSASVAAVRTCANATWATQAPTVASAKRVSLARTRM
jgi:hypothetical protein